MHSASPPEPAVPLGDTGAEIRPFAPEDLPSLESIREAAFAPVFQSFRRIVGPEIAAAAFGNLEADQQKLLQDIVSAGSGQRLFVVIQEGAIVAFVAFTADREKKLGEIGLNATHPHHAGKGIGTAMYRFVLDRLRDLGMRAVEVSTGGDSGHAAARRAYEKVGFGPVIPAVHMYRLL